MQHAQSGSLCEYQHHYRQARRELHGISALSLRSHQRSHWCGSARQLLERSASLCLLTFEHRWDRKPQHRGRTTGRYRALAQAVQRACKEPISNGKHDRGCRPFGCKSRSHWVLYAFRSWTSDGFSECCRLRVDSMTNVLSRSQACCIDFAHVKQGACRFNS